MLKKKETHNIMGNYIKKKKLNHLIFVEYFLKICLVFMNVLSITKTNGDENPFPVVETKYDDEKYFTDLI